jgi:hypothetical protein
VGSGVAPGNLLAKLSSSWCYMLILAGPVKAELTFTGPHAAELVKLHEHLLAPPGIPAERNLRIPESLCRQLPGGRRLAAGTISVDS